MTSETPAITVLPESVARLGGALDARRDAADTLRGLDWVLTLPNVAAPGFLYLAGACRGHAVGGGGRDLAEASARLAGETAEVLAQTAPPTPCDALDADPAIDAIWTSHPQPTRIRGLNMTRDLHLGLPACAIHLDPRLGAEYHPSAPPRSLGLAAGPDLATARLNGLLELIERDAAARWWRDGTRPHALDTVHAAPAAADLARLRTGAVAPARATSFLDLGSPTGLAVVCALSRDTERGLAFGLKAALCPLAAAQGAMIELLQMELALELARHRAAQGATTPGDRGPLARAALDPDAFPAFAAHPAVPRTYPSIAGLDDLIAHLAALGHQVTVADLPDQGGLAVSKVFVPSLRAMPGHTTPPRADAPGSQADLM